MHCTYCGSKAHIEKLCPKTSAGSSARAQLRCSYCGGRDHRVHACPKTHGGNSIRRNYPDLVADHFVLDKRRR